MNTKHLLVSFLVLLTVTLTVAIANAQGPSPLPSTSTAPTASAGTAFTYQGQLKQGATPVNDQCDFQFGLWTAVSVGTQVGITQTLSAINVTNGLFTVSIDFGANAFNGEARWLAIAVRCPKGSGEYTALNPRQPLTAAPYATYSIGNWGLKGNSGTTANNFLGTTDNTTLTLGVSNTAALRLIPAVDAPIVIGGYAGNAVNGQGDGAAIAGGGSSVFGANIMTGTNVTWAMIGGGVNNRINGNAYQSTIGGGRNNVISGTDAFLATISGGGGNLVSNYEATIGGGNGNFASGGRATIGGGAYNFSTGSAATIGGGFGNLASGYGATVPGGLSNSATMSDTFAAGQQAQAQHQGTFVWADSTNAPFASTGNNQFLIRANGGVGVNANTLYSATLFVQSNSANTGNNTAQFSAPNLGQNSSHIHFGSTGDWYIRSAASAGKVILQDTGGNVGIRTTAPDRALDVNGVIGVFDLGTRTYYGGLASEEGSQLIELGINDSSSNRFGGSYNVSAQGGMFRVDTRPGQNLYQFYGRIPGNASLNLIATLSNLGALIINNTLTIGSMGSAGSSSLCLNSSNQVSFCSSSLRYKNNVENLPLGLETIAHLRPVTFNWKTDGASDLGFVAEEVNQVSPLLTTLNKKGQIEGVKYDRISAVLVKAIQEQQQQIAELKAQNAAQRQEIAQLRNSGVPVADRSFNPFNLIGVLALGGVIAIGLRQWRSRKA